MIQTCRHQVLILATRRACATLESLEPRKLLAGDVTLNGTAANDSFLFTRNGSVGAAFLNGSTVAAATWDPSTVGVVIVNGLDGNDSVHLDNSTGGDPLSTFGMRFEGGTGIDSLTITGASGVESATLSAGRVTLIADPLNYSNVESLILNLGAGTDTISAAGNASITATGLLLNVSAGKLRVASGTTLPTFAAVNVANNAIFDLAGVNTTLDTISGGGRILNDGAAATLGIGQASGSSLFSGSLENGTGVLSLFKRGEGRIELSGSSNYSGLTTIESGALRVSNSAALGSNAAGVYISAGALTGLLELSGGIGIADAIDLGAKNAPSGSILLPSLVNVSGRNVITSRVTGSFGGTGYQLRSDAGTLVFAGPFQRTDGSAYHRPFQFTGTGDGRFEGVVDQTSTSWGFSFQKYDSGTWTFSQNKAIGNTRVDAGTLVMDKLSTASVAPGTTVNGGTLRVAAGTLPFDPTSSSTISGISMPGTAVRQLDVTNNLIIVDYSTTSPLSSLRSMVNSGIIFSSSANFRVAIYEASDRFGSSLPTTLAGQTVDSTSVVIQAALAGDINLDNTVNFDDLLALAQAYGSPTLGGWTNGDFNLDGTVNFDDLLALAQSYGQSTATSAAWKPIAQANLTQTPSSSFSDEDLRYAQPLYWFSQVANAVTETGSTRGFIDLSVWREPVDNQPYNARVLENQVAFAYFYSTNKSWNPYYGDPQVRARLEATLEYWISLQNSAGQWPEYSPTNYSLAPTSFGLRLMVRSLELLESGPGIDEGVMRRTVDATLKGLRAMTQDNTLLALGNDYSNQYTAVYAAVLGFLDLYPEYSNELLGNLRLRAPQISSQHQSPAGFMYEAGAADWAYTLGTHETQLWVGWHDIRGSEFQQRVVSDLAEYYNFTNYNLIREPSGTGYVSNYGATSRTGGRFFTALTNPMSEFVPEARYLNKTAAEEASALTSLRTSLSSSWGNWGTLAVPNSASYTPSPFADLDRVGWRPTDAQRTASINLLPYIASNRFNQQAVDSRRPLQFTFVRRPTYYATFNTGNIVTAQQRYGLGVLWNPTFGSVMQSQANNDTLAWGTRASGGARVYEATSRTTNFTLNGSPLTPMAGNSRLADGNISGSYPLETAGTKSVSFDETGATVAINHTGAFSEEFPLLRKSSETISTSPTRISLTRNGVTFAIDILTPGATVSLTNTTTNIGGGLLLSRVVVNASGALTYRISFSGGAALQSPLAPTLPLSPAAAKQTARRGVIDQFEL